MINAYIISTHPMYEVKLFGKRHNQRLNLRLSAFGASIRIALALETRRMTMDTATSILVMLLGDKHAYHISVKITIIA